MILSNANSPTFTFLSFDSLIPDYKFLQIISHSGVSRITLFLYFLLYHRAIPRIQPTSHHYCTVIVVDPRMSPSRLSARGQSYNFTYTVFLPQCMCLIYLSASRLFNQFPSLTPFTQVQKNPLERKIDQLRTFQSEYRSLVNF